MCFTYKKCVYRDLRMFWCLWNKCVSTRSLKLHLVEQFCTCYVSERLSQHALHMSCVYNFYNFSSLKVFVHNKTFHCWQKRKVTFVLRSTVIFAIAVYLLFDMVARIFAQGKCHFLLSRKVMTLWHGVFACVCDFCKSCYLGYLLHRHNYVHDSVLWLANMKFFAL